MSDEQNDNQKKAELEAQTQHVMSVALSNLTVVIDQLDSLKDTRVESTLTSLNTAKTDLQKQIT